MRGVLLEIFKRTPFAFQMGSSDILFYSKLLQSYKI